jgi:hypothetical protein
MREGDRSGRQEGCALPKYQGAPYPWLLPQLPPLQPPLPQPYPGSS